MKTNIKNSFLQPALIAGLSLIPAVHLAAQTFTVLKSFGIFTNISGFSPQSTLVQGPDGTLYGTARYGERPVAGTIFKMRPDGSGFTVLKRFTNSIEGTNPIAGLTLSGSVLYGTTSQGGSLNYGTVFKLNTDGTAYTVLKHFSGSDGANPCYASLTLSGSVLYGATYYGGSANAGTLFKLNTDGTGFVNLQSFTAPDPTYRTNSDGANPNFALTLSGSVIYGTAENGGGSGAGTVFKVNTDGSGYTLLKSFAFSDGAFPDSVLTLSGSVLYGTTYRGPPYGGVSYGYGTVFKVNTDGTGFSSIHNFTPLDPFYFTNSDGVNPSGPLQLSGSFLYGTTSQGGSALSSGFGAGAAGTVFKLNTNGAGFTVLKNFTNSLDGGNPLGGLMLSGSQLFGTTANGGSGGNGAVFRLNTDGTGYTVLKSFAYSDAAYPQAALTLSGGVLYGTTERGGNGGNLGNGTVFKVNTDGTGFMLLHSFAATDGYGAPNSDGQGPDAGLILSGSTLYGTARLGGNTPGSPNGNGTVFSVSTDGTGFSTVHSFTYLSALNTNMDGQWPEAALTLSGNILYGTAYQGGNSGAGAVFAINTDGTGFTTLYSFTALPDWYSTNSDGGHPEAELILSGNTLYGTAYFGGSSGGGTVFAVNTDGTGFTVLHSFTADSGPPSYTNSDGAYPEGGLILSGSTLYGTASVDGSLGGGTVFTVKTDGTGFTTLHNFTNASSSGETNSDGTCPRAGLILSGNTLYGTTANGGSSGNGTVFAVKTDGTGFTTLHSFIDGSDLFAVQAGLILAGNTLYGTTVGGGDLGEGTVFSLTFRPQLTITPCGSNVILTWPTNVAGFDYTGYTLQSTTNLVPPVVWTTNSPVPVVVNGLNTVTNSISGAQQFFRLIQ